MAACDSRPQDYAALCGARAVHVAHVRLPNDQPARNPAVQAFFVPFGLDRRIQGMRDVCTGLDSEAGR